MKNKVLGLLSEEYYLSGEKLAEKLGISRTAVWKQIKSLKIKGYKINSIKNKGYKIISRPDKPYFEEVSNKLNKDIIGKNILFFEKIDSTNLYAKKLVKEGVSEGYVVVAGMQEKGRGRKNRIWYSPDGGLWFSVILYPRIPPQNAMIITMAASVSIVDAIIKNTNLKPVIKWPNDVLVRGKKVCGILTELDSEMDLINSAVIGIGINVNNSISKKLKDIATSIKFETKNYCSIVELFVDIINNFDKNYRCIKLGDFKFIKDLWLSYANIIGKNIRVDTENLTFEGIVIDVDNEGCLIIESSKGKIRLTCGDIRYI